MRKPEVGQTVYIKTLMRRGNDELKPATVTKVGRKHFTVGEDWRATQYYLDSWCENSGEYVSATKAYESIEQHQIEVDTAEANQWVKNHFNRAGRYSLSLEAAQKIRAIIEAEET